MALMNHETSMTWDYLLQEVLPPLVLPSDYEQALFPATEGLYLTMQECVDAENRLDALRTRQGVLLDRLNESAEFRNQFPASMYRALPKHDLARVMRQLGYFKGHPHVDPQQHRRNAKFTLDVGTAELDAVRAKYKEARAAYGNAEQAERLAEELRRSLVHLHGQWNKRLRSLLDAEEKLVMELEALNEKVFEVVDLDYDLHNYYAQHGPGDSACPGLRPLSSTSYGPDMYRLASSADVRHHTFLHRMAQIETRLKQPLRPEVRADLQRLLRDVERQYESARRTFDSCFASPSSSSSCRFVRAR